MTMTMAWLAANRSQSVHVSLRRPRLFSCDVPKVDVSSSKHTPNWSIPRPGLCRSPDKDKHRRNIRLAKLDTSGRSKTGDLVFAIRPTQKTGREEKPEGIVSFIGGCSCGWIHPILCYYVRRWRRSKYAVSNGNTKYVLSIRTCRCRLHSPKLQGAKRVATP